MSETQPGMSHEIYFDPASFYSLNNSTVENWGGRTVSQIASEQPQDACLLLERIMRKTPGLSIGYISVRTEVGVVDSVQDGMFAARGNLMYTLKNSIAGGTPIEPFTVAVGTLGTLLNKRRSLKDKRVEFMINIEPPALAY